MSKLRLIQAGVGGFGDGWVRGAASHSEEFELVAIADVQEAKLQAAAAHTGLPADRCFASLEAALDAVEADAVLTVTPPAVHVQHARLALGRGLHLITEKPLADTLEHGLEMVRLAREAGRQLVVSQNYRFTPVIQTFRAQVAAQVVGELGHGHMDFYIPADFTGTFRETMEYPLLLDMAIHHFDLIRCITGRNIARVQAHSFRPAWSWYRHDPGLKMILELEGGLPFSYSGDWSARGRDTTWNGDWRLQCELGSLHLDKDVISVARSEKWMKEQREETVAAQPIPYTGQAATLHALAEAIHSGVPAETSGQDNLWSFAAVEAGVQSARLGHAVDVAELLKS